MTEEAKQAARPPLTKGSMVAATLDIVTIYNVISSVEVSTLTFISVKTVFFHCGCPDEFTQIARTYNLQSFDNGDFLITLSRYFTVNK